MVSCLLLNSGVRICYFYLIGLVKFIESDGVHGAAAEGDDEEDEDDDLGHDEL